MINLDWMYVEKAASMNRLLSIVTCIGTYSLIFKYMSINGIIVKVY